MPQRNTNANDSPDAAAAANVTPAHARFQWSASRYRGVYKRYTKDEALKKWYATASYGHKNFYLGGYECEEDAADAYDAAQHTMFRRGLITLQQRNNRVNFYTNHNLDIVQRVTRVLERRFDYEGILPQPMVTRVTLPVTPLFSRVRTPNLDPNAPTPGSSSPSLGLPWTDSEYDDTEHEVYPGVSEISQCLQKIFDDFDRQEVKMLNPECRSYFKSGPNISPIATPVPSPAASDSNRSHVSLSALPQLFADSREEQINSRLDESTFDPYEQSKKRRLG